MTTVIPGGKKCARRAGIAGGAGPRVPVLVDSVDLVKERALQLMAAVSPSPIRKKRSNMTNVIPRCGAQTEAQLEG
jgi:hypothetical protein